MATTAVGSVACTSEGRTVQHRLSKRPMISMPPDRVSSAPFSSDEMQVSQHSSTAACGWEQEVHFTVLIANEVVWLCGCK